MVSLTATSKSKSNAAAAAATKAATVDMSTKIGGRIVRPALPVVDGSPSNALELGFQKTLDAFTAEHIPLESKEGIERRERVLDRMGSLCRVWIRSVCIAKGLPSDVVENAGGKLFTSGSYRLGVHEPGADIDTILVAPSMCHRADFFGTTTSYSADDEAAGATKRDPHSLAERIRRHPDVTNFVPVEGAAVPILTFDWEGINIDLLFARINSNSVGDFDIDNDAALDGADSATEKSLNGPRVTNLIAALVSGTPQRYQTFLQVVRCVRKWAKARGLYSNKSGYWGGVNINIGVALVVQLYPNACAASLLRKFFLVFKTWRWPQPVLLTKPHDAGYGLPVWSPQTARQQVAPMITPAYPAMNSTLAVSRQTLQILQGEFERAHVVVDKLWRQYSKDQADLDWGILFEPSDFFISYPHYLSLCIVGPTQSDAQAWCGFVESRFRKLVSDMLGRSLPLKKIQLWPKKFEGCVADPGAILTLAQRQNSVTYFVGFQVDKHRMRGEQLNVELPLQTFRLELARFHPLVPGMDLLVKHFRVKELPKMCFETYKGGKYEAMQKRRKMRDEDPERQEKRRLARLDELKAKMAEIQRKKEEEQERKRKREEVELEDDYEVALDEEDQVENEESNLLESALDTIQDTGEMMIKTREEAEADRRKLLAGEMLDAGDAETGVESDEDEYGYNVDRARHSFLVRKTVTEDEEHQDIRSLPVTEKDAEILRKLGYSVVSDDESKVLGANMLPPWRSTSSAMQQEDLVGDARPRMRIRFREKFDIVALDAMGHVIDGGDQDFTPSKTWQGRKAGFEFKLGERGLGYYRTGKKVVVPSNTAY